MIKYKYINIFIHIYINRKIYTYRYFVLVYTFDNMKGSATKPFTETCTNTCLRTVLRTRSPLLVFTPRGSAARHRSCVRKGIHWLYL